MPQDNSTPDLSQQFLRFIQTQAVQRRGDEQLPQTLADWNDRQSELRKALQESWGEFPADPCPLEPRVLGELPRDGYRVQKLVFQTLPGIWMPANAYVPDGPGRRPAVLCVHGHWRMAKQDPVVQSRCIGLAKLGFFVLVVDAFGAGERGLQTALGEYHGEMVAATLWPTGLALAGLQVYENMRAVDYLQSRAEVDPDQIGITGASGGGNQSMYAGAIDERIKCVVPVCSVGTYQAYLGAACCMCEVTPKAAAYTEEWGVLSLVAPRALMVVSATRDAFQFSVGEAEKSLAKARHVFELQGVEDRLKHAVFESGHAYNQPMREAMYGWMTLHLKGMGDGSPVAEPEFATEDPETLRCFPGETRPTGFIALPQFAATEGRRLLATRMTPTHVEHWHANAMSMRMALPTVLGGFPSPSPLELQIKRNPDVPQDRIIEFRSEPGMTITCRIRPSAAKPRGRAVVLDLDQGTNAIDGELATELLKQGWTVVGVDLRGTGRTAVARDKIGRAPDHNSAEWSMWIGRPLLGQWVWDCRRLLDVLDGSSAKDATATALIGVGSASLVSLCASALDERVTHVATVGGLASFVSAVPYENQRLGIMVPGILRDVGDVPHLAALSAARRLVIAGGVTGGGTALPPNELRYNYEYTAAACHLEQAEDQLRILPDADPQKLVAQLS